MPSLNDIQKTHIILHKIKQANNSNSRLNVDLLSRILLEEVANDKLGTPLFNRPPQYSFIKR